MAAPRALRAALGVDHGGVHRGVLWRGLDYRSPCAAYPCVRQIGIAHSTGSRDGRALYDHVPYFPVHTLRSATHRRSQPLRRRACAGDRDRGNRLPALACAAGVRPGEHGWEHLGTMAATRHNTEPHEQPRAFIARGTVHAGCCHICNPGIDTRARISRHLAGCRSCLHGADTSTPSDRCCHRACPRPVGRSNRHERELGAARSARKSFSPRS